MAATIAALTFLAKTPLYEVEKPYTIIAPADRKDVNNTNRTNVQLEPHDGIMIDNIRDSMADFSLDSHGIQVLSYRTRYPRLDELSQCEGYNKEVTGLLEEQLGADLVRTWDLRRTDGRRSHDHVRKKRNVIEYDKAVDWDYKDQRQTEGPAIMAHVDFTFESGLMIINAYLNDDEKAKYLNSKYRVRIINTWRPMVSIIEHQPLAFCDPSTVKPEQLMACDRIMCDQLGEVYLLQFDPGNRWHWLEHQTSSEPYMLVSWDSDSTAKARYCPGTQALFRSFDL